MSFPAIAFADGEFAAALNPVVHKCEAVFVDACVWGVLADELDSRRTRALIDRPPAARLRTSPSIHRQACPVR